MLDRARIGRYIEQTGNNGKDSCQSFGSQISVLVLFDATARDMEILLDGIPIFIGEATRNLERNL